MIDSLGRTLVAHVIESITENPVKLVPEWAPLALLVFHVITVLHMNVVDTYSFSKFRS